MSSAGSKPALVASSSAASKRQAANSPGGHVDKRGRTQSNDEDDDEGNDTQPVSTRAWLSPILPSRNATHKFMPFMTVEELEGKLAQFSAREPSPAQEMANKAVSLDCDDEAWAAYKQDAIRKAIPAHPMLQERAWQLWGVKSHLKEHLDSLTTQPADRKKRQFIVVATISGAGKTRLATHCAVEAFPDALRDIVRTNPNKRSTLCPIVLSITFNSSTPFDNDKEENFEPETAVAIRLLYAYFEARDFDEFRATIGNMASVRVSDAIDLILNDARQRHPTTHPRVFVLIDEFNRLLTFDLDDLREMFPERVKEIEAKPRSDSKEDRLQRTFLYYAVDPLVMHSLSSTISSSLQLMLFGSYPGVLNKLFRVLGDQDPSPRGGSIYGVMSIDVPALSFGGVSALLDDVLVQPRLADRGEGWRVVPSLRGHLFVLGGIPRAVQKYAWTVREHLSQRLSVSTTESLDGVAVIALAAACSLTVGSIGPDLHVAEAALARSICGTRVEPDTRLTNTFTVAAAVSAGWCHLDNGVLKVPLYLFAALGQADLKAYPLSSLAHQLYLTLTEPGHEWEKFEVVVVILLQMRRIADSIETSNSGITVPGEPNWASGLHLNQITQSEFQSSADEARYPRTFNDVAKAHSRICGMKGQTNQDGTDGLLMSSLDPAPAVAQEARSCIAGLAGAPIAEADQQARSRPLVEFIQTKHSLQDTTVSNTTIEGLYGKLARMATDQPFFSRSAPVLGIVTAARLGRTMNKYAIPNYCWLATREDLPALFGGFSDLVQAILSPNINLSTVSILADALAGTFGGTQKEWEKIVEQTIWVERQVPGKAAPKVLRRSFKTHDEAFDALHAACSQEMQQRLGASRQQFDDLITL